MNKARLALVVASLCLALFAVYGCASNEMSNSNLTISNTAAPKTNTAVTDTKTLSASQVKRSTAKALLPVVADGTYSGEGQGRNGVIEVSVTVKDHAISDVQVTSQSETPEYFEKAQGFIKRIVRENSTEVDVISSATESCTGIQEAIDDALQKEVLKTIQ